MPNQHPENNIQIGSCLKKWILTQDKCGCEFHTAGMRGHVEDSKPVSNIWFGTKNLFGVASRFFIQLIGIFVIPAIVANADTRMRIISIRQMQPPQVIAPVAPSEGTLLCVELQNLPNKGDVLIVANLFLDKNQNGQVDIGEQKTILQMDKAGVKNQGILLANSRIAVPLSHPDIAEATEIEALLYSGNSHQSPKQIVRFNLNFEKALLNAPTALKAFVGKGQLFFRRIANIYNQTVRDASGPRYIFSTHIDPNGTPEGFIRLDATEGDIRALAITPSGDRVAWVRRIGLATELLWLKNDELTPRVIYRSTARLNCPWFIDANKMLLIEDGALLMFDHRNPSSLKPLNLPEIQVLQIYSLDRRNSHIELILKGRSTTSGITPSIFSASIDMRTYAAKVNRLPGNAFYPLYSGTQSSLPLFFPGKEKDQEGLYCLTAKPPKIKMLVKCRHPNFVRVSSNASRLVFACSDIESQE